MNKIVSIKANPTLDDIVLDPSRVKELSSDEALEELIRLSAIQSALMAQACCGKKEEKEVLGDRLLTVEEVAKTLSCDTDWVYRKAKSWPFSKKLSSKQLRFSQKGLEKYMKNLSHESY